MARQGTLMIVAIAAMGLLLICVGCASVSQSELTVEQLFISAENNQLADSKRLAVFDDLSTRSLTPQQKQQLEVMYSNIASDLRHSPAIRERVIADYVDLFPGDAATWLASQYRRTPEPKLRAVILGRINELHDPACLDMLVLALAYLVNDPAQATSGYSDLQHSLEVVSGQSLCELLIDQVENNPDSAVRRASLYVLMNRFGHDVARQAVQESMQETELDEQLREWLDLCDFLPRNSTDTMAMNVLSLQLSDDQKAALSRAVYQVKTHTSYSFAISDTYLLLNLPSEAIKQSRDDLERRVYAALTECDHAKRPASYQGALDDYSEGFIDQADRLSYTDLLVCHKLIDTLARPETVQYIRTVLAGDTAHPDTEVGGLIGLDGHALKFITYPPAIHGGDNQYVESPRMIQDSFFCISRWHCHAMQSSSFQHAGPGVDDMAFVLRHRVPLVIIAQLPAMRFNVDFVLSDGVVIDLGCYPGRLEER